MNKQSLLLAVIGLTALLSAKQPDILLVVTDCLRADHVGAYGYKRKTTPFTDRLAGQGTLFKNAYSVSSWTTPSIMSLFTSLPPRGHGLLDTKCRLPEGIQTLANELKKKGYATYGVLVNPCAAGRLGYDRGFDLYDDYTVLLDMEVNKGLSFITGKMETVPSLTNSTTSEEITDLALKILSSHPKGKPWFMFVFYFDPHDDYVPPQRYIKMFDPHYKGKVTGRVYGGKAGLQNYVYPDKRDLQHVVALFDGEIRFTDDQFKRFYQTAQRKGYIGKDTLTIITADHGEEFNEHGGNKHGRTLFEEGVKVPLIFHWPGKYPKRTVKGQVQLIDIMPTVLAKIGSKIPGQCTGIDLNPVIAGKRKLNGREIFFHLYIKYKLSGAKSVRYKAIRDLVSNSTFLYDLLKDPLERRPLKKITKAAGQFINRFHKREALVQKLYTANTKNKKRKKPVLSKRQLKVLRSLGYLH